jgi:molecular chaperone GrpE
MNEEESKEPLETVEAAESAATEVESPEQKLRSEMLYLRAEFENTKRRLIREQENSIRFANDRMVGDLLNVVDMFERALHSGVNLKSDQSDEVKSFVTGIEMTHRELVHLFTRFGAELIGKVGEKFNPAQHEAVAQSPAESDLVDCVTAVAQRGCVLHGRLLKPAKVVVGVAKS